MFSANILRYVIDAISLYMALYMVYKSQSEVFEIRAIEDWSMMGAITFSICGFWLIYREML